MLAKRLENLHPYVPGEQPKDRDYIKLNANENPFPPHESVAAAIKTAVTEKIEKLAFILTPIPQNSEKQLQTCLTKQAAFLIQ